MRRPFPLTLLGGVQFGAFAAACIVLLGDATLDGELTAGDVALVVAVALAGAAVVGSTWYGGPVALGVEVVLAAAAVAAGVAWVAAADPPLPGLPVAVAGVLWLAAVALPGARAWFLRPQD